MRAYPGILEAASFCLKVQVHQGTASEQKGRIRVQQRLSSHQGDRPLLEPVVSSQFCAASH